MLGEHAACIEIDSSLSVHYYFDYSSCDLTQSNHRMRDLTVVISCERVNGLDRSVTPWRKVHDVTPSANL